jgi:hypothetical protein
VWDFLGSATDCLPTKSVAPLQKLRQLCDVNCNSSRLIPRQQFRRRSPAGFILKIDIRQLLPCAVLHEEAGFQFID